MNRPGERNEGDGVEDTMEDGGWRTGERRETRTKYKECRSQRVTRISFDGITWRLRVGTVITFVVYR